MNKLRLLIIDSSKIFCASARQYLLNCPYVDCVQIAYSIDQALGMVDLLQPHNIIIDAKLLQYNTGVENKLFKLMEKVPEARIVCLTLYAEKFDKYDIFQSDTCISMVSKENFAHDINQLFGDSIKIH